MLEEGDPLRPRRNPANYYLAFYGRPDEAAWSWRFEGHHVSVSYTVVDGRSLAPTPLFFGSNPAEVRHADQPIVRLLGEEEDRGRDLFKALRADQKAQALVCDAAPPDIVTRNLIDLTPPIVPEPTGPGLPAGYRFPEEARQLLAYAEPARGLAVADMDAAQKEKVWTLIRAYVERLPEDLATAELERLAAVGIADLRFAWAGAAEPRRPHYYRLQAPTLVIELRQHPERYEPHPRRLAQSWQRLRRRHPRAPLPAGTLGARATGGGEGLAQVLDELVHQRGGLVPDQGLAELREAAGELDICSEPYLGALRPGLEQQRLEERFDAGADAAVAAFAAQAPDIVFSLQMRPARDRESQRADAQADAAVILIRPDGLYVFDAGNAARHGRDVLEEGAHLVGRCVEDECLVELHALTRPRACSTARRVKTTAMSRL